jgi:hypothetical protein
MMDHYSHIRMVARRKALAIVSYVRFLSGLPSSLQVETDNDRTHSFPSQEP